MITNIYNYIYIYILYYYVNDLSFVSCSCFFLQRFFSDFGSNNSPQKSGEDVVTGENAWRSLPSGEHTKKRWKITIFNR